MTTDPLVSSKRKRRLFLIYWGVFALLVLVSFFLWVFIFRFKVYTDDAYVEGNQIFITPLRSGFVQAIHTDDTFLVTKGQLLIELDRTDALIALDQAKEELAKVVRQVCQFFHDVFVYKSEIEIKQAEWIRAAQDYQHREDVLDAEGVSLEDYQHAVAALRSSYFSLQLTKSLYERAFAIVQGTTIKNHPLVQAAADQLREAWVQLYRCNIYAPAEGLAAQRTIQVGMWVNPGQPLLSVIPLDQIWVNANFKETQLKHMRIGQSVRLTSDFYGSQIVFRGQIVGIPGGAGNAFSLLPPQNLSGNWIKIVQRLPVRVDLDPEELKRHPLRIGLSMEATAHLRDREGPMIPTSSKGSPVYQTLIFEDEEKGNREVIEAIICANLDPSLLHYAETPLLLEIPSTSETVQLGLDKLLRQTFPFERPSDESIPFFDLLSQWIPHFQEGGGFLSR